VQSLIGVEHRGQPDQVLLVAPAAVVEDHEPVRLSPRGALGEG
jgi:hypothetical protein